MGVDVIGLAPVVETGWDAVFTEAKDAGIPIILVDRMADVPEDLYATFIGSDFIEEGKNAADEMAKLIGNSGKIGTARRHRGRLRCERPQEGL